MEGLAGGRAGAVVAYFATAALYDLQSACSAYLRVRLMRAQDASQSGITIAIYLATFLCSCAVSEGELDGKR